MSGPTGQRVAYVQRKIKLIARVARRAVARRASEAPSTGSVLKGQKPIGSLIKNFEVHETLNYIFISISYNVAKYACVIVLRLRRDYAHRVEGQLALRVS